MPYRKDVDIPKWVQEKAMELEEEGQDPGAAKAIAWSIYCRYVKPGSRHCHKEPHEYLTGNGKKAALGIAMKLAAIVSIKSDENPNKKYSVRMERGIAYACNCPAGQRGLPCKHLKRAENKEDYMRAQDTLIKAGVYGSVKEVNSAFYWLKMQLGVDGAIDAIIKQADDVRKYGVEHVKRIRKAFASRFGYED